MVDNKRWRFLANRAAKLARQRRRRKRATHKVWPHLTRDQQEVAKRLSKGQISLVTISGWGFLVHDQATFSGMTRCCSYLHPKLS